MSSAVLERVGSWFGRAPAVTGTPVRLARPAGPDRLLCGAVLCLAALGLVMVFSASAAGEAQKYGDWTYFLKRHSIFLAMGLGAFVVGLRTDYALYRRFTYPLLFLAILLLVAVMFAGAEAKGATRWLRIGPLSLQPSELSKFALVLYLSVLLARNAEKVRAFSMGFLPPLVMTGIVVALLLKQKDLGTSVILLATALVMLFVAGTRTSYIVVAVLVAVPVGWQKLILGEAYRVRRILAFMDPWSYCKKESYQLCESLISVGSGGITGVGLGASRQKLFFLPEAHNDFILAVIGEELGMVGLMAVLVAFVLLICRGMAASLRARDVFGSYLAFGITALFGLQALMNMAVVLGLLPTKGLTLPFVSYGGTSLMVSLFMAGVLGNISARNPEPRPSTFFGAWRRRRLANKNRKAERAPRIIVEVGRKKRTVPPPIPPAPAVEPGPTAPPPTLLDEMPTERDSQAN